MESEELYDSLDEETIISGGSIKKTLPQIIKKISPPDLSKLVPFYGREIRKEDIKFPTVARKKKSLNYNILPPKLETNNINGNTQATSATNIVKRTKSKASVFSSSSSLNTIIPNYKHKKSYLDLFHTKIGYIKGSNQNDNDTARAVKGGDTFRTACSSEGENSSEFSDAISFVSDSSSRHIEKDIKNKTQCLYADSSPKLASRSKCSQSSLSESLCQLKSVSEYSVANYKLDKPKPPSVSLKLTRFNKSVMDVPALGGLGPDHITNREKLLRLKKQQTYGQRVSNQNRMKIMESQIVKNFKLELKKSNELNKCTESVFNTG